jgi:hypothetical protein
MEAEMTEAQCDMAFRLVSELSIYAKASDQYGNSRMAACMRNAASLLAKMLEEAEQLAPKERSDV